MQALTTESNGCQVRVCNQLAAFEIDYDCGEGDDQTIRVCKDHYEAHDVLPSGEKFYYFKKFAKNIEVLVS